MDGVKHTYYYAGGKLLRETYGSNTLDFFYDANGTPYALKYNGTLYYYITNLQGDVMRIVDGTGTNVAKYRYDPYGNLVSSSGTMAAANPLRYRGYYFDSETGFYYLQSRYYDPKICRFINADDFVSTGQGILGHNMFAYCGNNPVNNSDATGFSFQELYQAFQQALNEGTSYFTFALAVSQVDTPILGVCDVIAIGLFTAGVLYHGANAIYDVLSSGDGISSTTLGSESTKKQLGNIASTYDNFECRKAAQSMSDYLRRNGKKAEIITIRFVGGRDYIWSDTANKTISQNGIHVGVLFNGYVFCNVHPFGLPEDQWVNDFHGTGTKLVLKAPI